MTLGEAVNSCLKKKYATFEGRAPRSEYWYFALFFFLGYIALAIVAGVLGAISEVLALVALVAIMIFALGMIVPSIAVAVRRMHDIDKSGWWLLIGLVPLVGGIILIVFYCTKGTAGDNRFGPDPLGGAGMAAHPAE